MISRNPAITVFGCKNAGNAAIARFFSCSVSRNCIPNQKPSSWAEIAEHCLLTLTAFKQPLSLINLTRVLTICLLMPSSWLNAAELDCMVKPEMYIELSSPVTGVLEKVMVNKGDHVRKGQPVAKLEDSVEVARVNQAKVDAASNSDLNNRKTQLEFARRTLQRYAGLSQRNAVSQFEKDKADTEVTLAEIELKKANENKKAAAMALEVAKKQLGQKTIRSPIDGIVIDRYAMVGESVEDRAIMKLAQVNPLRVELVAPTEYFGMIEKGMMVDIRPERPANKLFKAKVNVVDQLIDPASGSFTVRMALPNPDDQLVGGVNCTALFNFKTPSLAATSDNPESSAETDQEKPFQPDNPFKKAAPVDSQ